jgi:hypothetical protein
MPHPIAQRSAWRFCTRATINNSVGTSATRQAPVNYHSSLACRLLLGMTIDWGGALQLQWEYLQVDLGDLQQGHDDVDLLNDAGNEGWELVAITVNGIAYLKRAIKEPARARAPSKSAPHGIE